MQGLQATKNKTKTSQDAQKTILFQSFFLPMVIAGTIIKELLSSLGFLSHIFTKNQSRILNLHEILTIEIVLIKKPTNNK